jgi:hypothetical protein
MLGKYWESAVKVNGVLLLGADEWPPDDGLLNTVRHRRPRRRRKVRCDFFEPVDPQNAEHAGLLVDGELVAVGRVDLFSVKESNNEHDAVLSSERGLERSYDRIAAVPDPIVGRGRERRGNVA